MLHFEGFLLSNFVLHSSNMASLNLFYSWGSRTYESERDGFDENTKVVLSVAAAAFTLSIRTKLNMKVGILILYYLLT